MLLCFAWLALLLESSLYRKTNPESSRFLMLEFQSRGGGSDPPIDCNRLNATFRERLAPLARRCRALARHTLTLHEGMFLVGTVYHLCTPHESLSHTQQTTPAMAGWDHRPLLDDARTVVVSCAAAPLGTLEAARASFAGISTPDQALVFVTTVKCGATISLSASAMPAIAR